MEPTTMEARPTAYVATTLTNRDRQREVVEALLARGIDQAFDWTRQGTASGRPWPAVAQDEVKAVLDCDLFILLLPGGKGAHAELGLALSKPGKCILLQASAALLEEANCVFHRHPAITLVSEDSGALLTEVDKWLAGWRR